MSLDEEISIRAGGMRRKNEIYNGYIQDIPKEYENATVRNWKIVRAFVGSNYDILAVEIDSKFAGKDVLESHKNDYKNKSKLSIPEEIVYDKENKFMYDKDKYEGIWLIKKDGKYVKDFSDGKEFTKSIDKAEKYTTRKSAQVAAMMYSKKKLGKWYTIFKYN